MRSSALRHVVLSLIVATVLVACKEEAKKTDAAPAPRPVRVVTVSAGAETRTLRFSGSVRARVETALGFRVPGKIVERLVDIGNKVETGRVLARLDPTDLRLALQTAEANVGAARSRVRVAEDNQRRARTLNTKGFVADSSLDSVGLEVDQARAALEAAMSARDQAINQAGYAELVTDSDGIVTDLKADVGQVVAAGTSVMTLAHDDEKEVAIAVPEQDVVRFHKDQPVAVRFWADATLSMTGRVREIAGSADPASRTYALRVSLPADERVRLGMTATVEATVPISEGTIVVPLTALGSKDGRSLVWIVDSESATVSPREVTLGRVAADGVRVVSGLEPGEILVTAGTQFLVPGQKVALPRPGEPAAAATAAPLVR